jgi:hypothetical protein
MNEKPHLGDVMSLLIAICGAALELSDLLPAKAACAVFALAATLRVGVKFLGSQKQKDAFVEGQDLGKELKPDIQVLTAKKAEPV